MAVKAADMIYRVLRHTWEAINVEVQEGLALVIDGGAHNTATFLASASV